MKIEINYDYIFEIKKYQVDKLYIIFTNSVPFTRSFFTCRTALFAGYIYFNKYQRVLLKEIRPVTSESVTIQNTQNQLNYRIKQSPLSLIFSLLHFRI
jgi:hypothetical protein